MNRSMKTAVAAIVCVAGVAVMTTLAQDAKAPAPEYVGAESCKKCHLKQFKSWKETKMALAFEILKPGQAKEAKEKLKLDPAKDYTQDEKCLPCHTTGYGKPGGYPAVGKAWTDAEKQLAREREGNQCESCHGPGSLYIPVKKENKEYKIDAIKDLGWHRADEAACLTCHNKESPSFAPDAKFDFEAMHKKDKELHEHVELKYKH